MKRRIWLRVGLALLLSAGFSASSVILTVPAYRTAFHTHLAAFLETIRGLDAWGPIIVGVAFIPACLFFLPGSPLTLFGGFAFGGTFRGLAAVTACVSAGSTIGAALAFLVGRSVARPWIEKKVTADPRYQAIDAAVTESGFKIVLLSRLSPVFPFNLLNYSFGLTKVSFRDYLLASWMGMLPGTILYVYLGSTLGALADVVAGRVEKNAAQQALYYLGLAATLTVTVLITRIAKQALARVVPTDREVRPGEDKHRGSTSM